MKNQQFSFGNSKNQDYIPKLPSTNSPKYNVPIPSQQKYKHIHNQSTFSLNPLLARLNSGNKQRQLMLSKTSNKYLKLTKEQLIVLLLQSQSKLQSYKLKVSGNKDKMVELSQLLFQYQQTNKESKGNIQKFQNYINTINNEYKQKLSIIQKENTQIKEQIQVYKNCLKKLQACVQIKDKDFKILKQKQKSQAQQNIKIKEQIQQLKKKNIIITTDNEKLSEQNKKIKVINQTEKKDYEKRILQKQELIKKMSQFNNQICERMIYQKYEKPKGNLSNHKQKIEISMKYNDSNLSRVQSQRGFFKKNSIQQQNQNLQEVNYKLKKKNQILIYQNQILKQKVEESQQKILFMQQIIQQKQNKIEDLLQQNKNSIKIQNIDLQDMLYTDRTINTLKMQMNQKLKDQNNEDFVVKQQNQKQRFSYQQTQKFNKQTKKIEYKQQKMLRLERNKILLLQQMLKAQKSKNRQLLQRIQTIQNNYKYQRTSGHYSTHQSDIQINSFIKNIQLLVRKKFNQNNQTHNYLSNNTDQYFYQSIIKLCQLAKKDKIQNLGKLRVSQVKQSISNDFKIENKNKNLIWSTAKRQGSPNWPSSNKNTDYIVELKKYMKNK